MNLASVLHWDTQIVGSGEQVNKINPEMFTVNINLEMFTDWHYSVIQHVIGQNIVKTPNSNCEGYASLKI